MQVRGSRWLAVVLWSAASSALGSSLCYNSSVRRSEAELAAELQTLPPAVRGYHASYEAARQRDPVLETLLPRDVVYELLARPEGEFLTMFMSKALEVMAADNAPIDTSTLDVGRWGNTTAAAGADKLRRALRKVLENKVPESQIEERLNGLGSNDQRAIERALGYLNVADANLLVHGGNPLAPTPTSLLGKYIAEARAATVVRTFGSRPTQGGGYGGQPIDPNSSQGPRKLVVALSQATLPIYRKYFEIPNLMVHAHGVGQGTLYVGFMGIGGSYSALARPGSGGSEMRFSQGAIWPHIILSTSEGGRTRTYFDIGIRDRDVVKSPWTRLPGFCARGGYNSCTHWWGEAGIGDARVTEWVFPGRVDQHASGPTPGVSEEADKAPRRQRLAAYQMPSHLDPVTAAQVRRFMTAPEAGEQLAVMLGTEAQLTYGEWANPGYVAITLLAKARQERVPFLFYHVGDATQPIPADFDPGVRAY